MSKSRSLEDVLRAGGECRDGDEITMLLELSLKVFEASPDKRAAADLMARPARLRLPERAERQRAHALPYFDANDGVETELELVVSRPATPAATPAPTRRRTAAATASRRELRATPIAAAARRRR